MENPPIRLNALIAGILEAQPGPDALARVEAACRSAAELDELADHLIGHFVDEARAVGFTWTQIGEHIGVTKQAARKRFAPRDVPEKTLDAPALHDDVRIKSRDKVFGRYTDYAKHVVVLSQDNARKHGHPFIETEHILLGLCQEDRGAGAGAIVACGVEIADLQAAVTARLAPASAQPKGHIPFTQESKKVLELSVRASLLLGHDHVGTEHLLLGLIAEETGLAARILGEAGITAESAEREVLRIVGP